MTKESTNTGVIIEIRASINNGHIIYDYDYSRIIIITSPMQHQISINLYHQLKEYKKPCFRLYAIILAEHTMLHIIWKVSVTDCVPYVYIVKVKLH